MKAKAIFQILMDEAVQRRDPTCDGLIAGDENKTVRKAGVCFKLTAALIEQAAKEQIDMIIAHEPTFSTGDTVDESNPVDRMKNDLLHKSGITLYRFHDHAHTSEPDYIHAGFINALQLKIGKKHERASLGVCRYDLDEPLTTRELALRIHEKLGVSLIRIVGQDDYPLKTICLGLGAVGLQQIRLLVESDCDLFVTGEVAEVCTAETVRDACYFGLKKSLLILGHYSSEYIGMRLLADTLNQRIVPAVFLDSGEVYHGI
jgi:putative NIF3 family GTP cyclohydrolase 1 type 2